MVDRKYLKIEMDEAGRYILPQELINKYGFRNGSQVILNEIQTGFSLSQSSDSLARVYIEPTNICNLDCATCMRNVWHEPLGRMTYETFTHIVNEIQKLEEKPSIFFGGFGEPLTHPRILDMISTAKRVGSSVELISNGILLSPTINSALVDLGLNRLWVSIDGATPESYEDVRLGDALPRVIENLKNLRQQKIDRQDKEGNPKLGIAFVAMRKNINDLPAVMDLGQSLGADMFSVSNVLPHTIELRQDALYVGPHNTDTPITEWAPLLSLPRMEINQYTKSSILRAVSKAGAVSIARNEIKTGANTCPFIEKGSTSIRWDGAVSPCLALLHENDNYLDFRKRSTKSFSFGDINQSSLIHIWNQEEYASFRRRLQSFDFAYCTSCNGCDMADSNLEDCYGSPAPTCGACLWGQGFIQCP